jgi:hypothetical protein
MAKFPHAMAELVFVTSHSGCLVLQKLASLSGGFLLFRLPPTEDCLAMAAALLEEGIRRR